MDLESQVFVRMRAASLPDDIDHSRPQAVMVLAVVVISAVVYFPFFMQPFKSRNYSFGAGPLNLDDPALGVVSYLADVEDLSDSKMKDMFGWGGLDLIQRASQSLAPFLQNCRARTQSPVLRAGMTFNFDVKIDVKKPGFAVTGILSGHDLEPDVATCLRDKINNLQISDFASLRAAKPKSYKLRLGVQLAHGADGGVP
jgi:hypothetical protein